jgi:hypothetical protein
MIVGDIIGNVLEASKCIDERGHQAKGIAFKKIVYADLFCRVSFVAVQLVVREFIVLQGKIRYAEFFLGRWIRDMNRQWSTSSGGLCPQAGHCLFPRLGQRSLFSWSKMGQCIQCHRPRDKTCRSMLAERISTMPMTDLQTAANPALCHKLPSGQEITGLQA